MMPPPPSSMPELGFHLEVSQQQQQQQQGASSTMPQGGSTLRDAIVVDTDTTGQGFRPIAIQIRSEACKGG